MLIRTWRFVTVLLVALLLGLAFAHVLERPAKMLYDAELYVTLQKTLYVAWGPPNAGGFLEPRPFSLCFRWLSWSARGSERSGSRLVQASPCCSPFQSYFLSSWPRQTQPFWRRL
jgi:hypothetical protein